MEILGKSDVDLVAYNGFHMDKVTRQSLGMAEKANESGEDQMDSVLDETGQFGKYQIFYLLLILVPALLAAPYEVNFIVTSATDDYR